jgi:ferredoxin
MVLRNIVKIDEDKSDGCGLCITACAEGAIEMVNGKAKLVSEIYCDGLGACLSHCPQGAITIEQRQGKQFDEEATEKHLAEQKTCPASTGFVCPGLANNSGKRLPQKTHMQAVRLDLN